MVFLLIIAIIVIIGFVSFNYFKMTIDEILQKLVLLDKIFEERYNELTKSISQFQKYMPENKDMLFEIQRSKADAAKVSKPKTTKELAQKILNENALTLNINNLINNCDFQNINPIVKECADKQVFYINKIKTEAIEYNKLISDYKKIKNKFPFNLYSKMINIDLDLDLIQII